MTATAVHELVAEQRRTMTAAAREAYRQELEQRVNPDGTMSPDEVTQAVRTLRSQIMSDLAKRSVASRRAKAGQRARTKAEQALDELVDVIAVAVADRLPKAS